ncbi:hypothetical protein ACSQ6I_12495 [Anabaena sp. WFMT]|uniref:hypothetical protein n=1 Tax=Anabaena sp. WFMT TaxID=3449730 RepID=UPI003F245DC3
MSPRRLTLWEAYISGLKPQGFRPAFLSEMSGIFSKQLVDSDLASVNTDSHG